MPAAAPTPISSLDAAALDRLAEGHVAELPTGLAELGASAVRRFYASVAGSSHLFGFAVLEAGEVLGAVVGSPEPDRAFEALSKRLIAQSVLQNPKVLPQMVWSRLRPAHEAARPEGSADLMYVFTRAAARGKGVGRALVQAFVDEGRTRGHRIVTLSVETDNAAAIALYEKLGFRVTSPPQKEGRHFRLRMATSADA